MFRKGQEATELIVLLAVIAIAGLLIYSTSQARLSESSQVLLMSQARATVNDLAGAASEVYSEGTGARRKVYITIPEGANSTRVQINGTMINIGLDLAFGVSTDINTQTSMNLVQGADFPTTPGSYWVYVTAMQGYVLIGSSNFVINPTSLSVTMSPSSSTSSVITFTDVGTVPLRVTLSPQWQYNATVNLTLNTTDFALFPTQAGSTVYVLATFQTYSNTTLQPYIGNIVVSTNTSETEGIPLNINVVGTQQPSGVSYMTIDTFKDSSYSTATTNFTLPKMVNINGSGWTAGAVTLNITNPSGISVSGYPTTVQANNSGYFNTTWNPAGNPPGSYTLGANQSGTTASTSFSITGCS
jgi:hypothetical protein